MFPVWLHYISAKLLFAESVNNHMKAKCPFCTGGCLKCENSGKVDVQFVKGSLWTRCCTICGFENGGRIEKGNIEPSEPSGKCVVCNAPTEWLLLGNMNDETKIPS